MDDRYQPAGIKPGLQGQARADLEMVLAAAQSDFIENWKADRFDKLRRLAEPNGYMLKPTDPLLQEPQRITAKLQEYKDAIPDETRKGFLSRLLNRRD